MLTEAHNTACQIAYTKQAMPWTRVTSPQPMHRTEANFKNITAPESPAPEL